MADSRKRIPTPKRPSLPLDKRGSVTKTSTAGRLASNAWLASRRLIPTTNNWEVEIALQVGEQPATFEPLDHGITRFHLSVYAEEWGYFFSHDGRATWIRVTDIPFVHGRDDFKLLDATPPLREIGSLVRALEHQFNIKFQREHAAVRSDIVGGELAVGLWVASL
ncbi:MAG: hypothetical protein JWO36_2538 [Myxococcales bacterium]|nr:hypothetical protein [Myxococcales bacterium]